MHVSVLIAHNDKRVSSLVYSLLRKFCGDHAIVECTTTSRIDQFVATATENKFELIIVSPECLGSSARHPRAFADRRAGACALRSIKALRRAPILAFDVAAEYHQEMLDAGADWVVGTPFQCDDLKTAFGRFLTFSNPVPHPAMDFAQSPVVNLYQRLRSRWLGETAQPEAA